MSDNIISLGLLHLSALSMLFLVIYIFRIKNKNLLHYLFGSLILLILSISLSQLFEVYIRYYTGKSNNLFVTLYYTGLIFIPLALLFVGFVYAKKDLSLNWKYLIPFVTQVITFFIMVTNKYHHLFLVKYSNNNALIEYGDYFKIHTLFAYIYIIMGLYNMLRFSIRNSGVFSRQSMYIFLSLFTPFLVNIMVTLKLLVLPTYSTAITTSITAFFLFIAITKFKLLKSIPLGMELIYNSMEDSILILDSDKKIIESNRTFKKKFSFINNGLLSDDSNIYNNNEEELILTSLKNNLSNISESNKILKFEIELLNNFYLVEIIMFKNKKFKLIEQKGSLIIFKNITQIKNLNKKIMEQDKLATLGVLSGGIAHDINNPASAIEAGLFYLNCAVPKLNETDGEEREILENKIMKNISLNKSACIRILTMVRSIKNQTRNLGSENIKEFLVNKLIKEVFIMTAHQFKKTGCTHEFIENTKIQVKGDYTKLSQVITNLVMNAIEAYGNKPGKIQIVLEENDNESIIIVRDEAGGIKNKNPDTIFKDIISTKTNGTGLGLYISHKIITSEFDGILSFKTELDVGTDFIISIPKTRVLTAV